MANALLKLTHWFAQQPFLLLPLLLLLRRGTFNPDKVVDFGDGHISLTAQQQMAYVEQVS